MVDWARDIINEFEKRENEEPDRQRKLRDLFAELSTGAHDGVTKLLDQHHQFKLILRFKNTAKTFTVSYNADPIVSVTMELAPSGLDCTVTVQNLVEAHLRQHKIPIDIGLGKEEILRAALEPIKERLLYQGFPM
jgi:hypothetical protein